MSANPPANQSPRVDTAVPSPMQQAILDIRALRTRLEASERKLRAPVAIVGMGCRFPGGVDSPESFWRLLSAGVDAIGDIPADRWDTAALYDPNPDAPGKMSTRSGGFLNDVDRFDAEFFGISDREAVSVDPQHRLLLEVAWEALEDAGVPAQQLFGTPAGVFVGISSFDYGQLRGELGDRTELDAYHATGIAHSAASGRLAYYLGLQGPTLSIDTACSSSLVAIHLACQSLRSGECRVALAGGVNLILSPEIHVTLSKARMMAPDGRCKAFDDRADGFVRSEGCGIVVLKLLSDALADGDRIHAVIRGSACNQDGRSSGLTAPNGPSQAAVLQAAWRTAGIGAEQLGYVETHGTGTALGDPIEAGALASAMQGLPPEHLLPIGSVKTNLGHMEAAAGVAGLIKTVLALEHEQLPPSLHFQTPSKNVDWEHAHLKVISQSTPWPRATAPVRAGNPRAGGALTPSPGIPGEGRGEGDFEHERPPQFQNTLTPTLSRDTGRGGSAAPGASRADRNTPRLAGVSSFGFSGTNVHIVLEESPLAPAPAANGSESPWHLLTISAMSEAALRQVAARLVQKLRETGEEPNALADIAYTLSAGRSHFPYRAAIVVKSAVEAAAILNELAQSGKGSAELIFGRADPLHAPEVILVTGTDRGSQRPGDNDRIVLQLDPGDRQMLTTLAGAYVRGARIDWKALHRGQPRRLVELPGYPWNRQRYWFPLAARPAGSTADERWQGVVASGDRQADTVPIDLNLHTYAGKYRAFDQLATAYIVRAFKTLGVFQSAGATLRPGDVIDSYGVLPLYRILMERWFQKLSAEGLLKESAGAYTAADPLKTPDPETLEKAATPLFADAPMLLDYVKGCGKLLAPILVGKTSPLDTLFPGGNLDLAEAIYHRAALSRYFNAIAGAAAAAFAQRHAGPLRVLEVGAGTGGTTASILPMLPADRTQYTFTDVSEFFFGHAARRFEKFPFLSFGLLDLERSPESQGYHLGQYDLIVAANVLHATKYLGQTLDFVRSLLTPDGVLVLYEVTDPPSYFDVSIALIEGWQIFEDDIRDTSPLLTTDQWKKCLLEHGFQQVVSWPASGTPAQVLGSHVLAVRATGGGQSAPPPLAVKPPVSQPRSFLLETTDDIGVSLADAPESEHGEILVGFVRRQVARVLRRSGQTEIPRDRRLMDLGLDSLMAVELRNNLSANLQLPQPLPATLIFDYPSVADIAAYLLVQLRKQQAASNGDAAKKSEPAMSNSTVESAVATSQKVTAARLNELSDADVERLLLDKLERM